MLLRLVNQQTIYGWKNIFIGLSVISLFVILILSQSAGSSGDEYIHSDHAKDVYNYFTTLGQDTTAVNTSSGLHRYGQSLDNEIKFFNEWFNIDDIYSSRHFFISFTGWILILFTGLIATLLYGWEAGTIALILTFFSPRILGHSFNNPKDLPFAAAYVFTIYFILKFLKNLPKVNYLSLVFIILGIGWATSLRIGGIILIPYLFLFFGVYYITSKQLYTKSGFIKAFKITLLLIAASVIAYFLGLILWPFALKDPINNPIESLKEMTNFEIGLNQLFDGEIIMSKNLPWFYGIKYIFITSPIIVFFGLIIFFITLAFRKAKRLDYIFYFVLTFACIFPIAYTIYKHSNLYGGWRHLLWTYSPIVILAAGGFEFFLKKDNKYFKYGTFAIIAVLLFHPVKHTFKNHPFEYIYYNQIVGGTKGAYGKYEMDYYYHSLRDGIDWFIENELSNDSVIVTTNHIRIAEYYFRNYPQVKVTYSRFYEKGKDDWDYAVWANVHISPEQLENGYWPPKKAIYTMNVDDIPIGAVVKRLSKEDYKGFEALKVNKVEEAKQHFKNFLDVYPENEEVLEGYARAFLMEGKLDSAITYSDSSIHYNPRQIGAWHLKATIYNTQKKYELALNAANKTLEIKEDFPEGQYQKGYALKNLSKPNEALKAFQAAASLKKDYNLAFMQMGEILMNYKNYKKALEIYKKVLDLNKDDLYATVYSAKCYHFLNDNANSNKLLNSLPSRYQNNFEVVKLKCRIAMQQNDWNNVVRYLNMARNINNNSELFVLRAQYLMKQKNVELAKQNLDKAIELDPINREALALEKLFPKAAKTVTTAKPKKEQAQPQSIMFQKPKPKKQPSPITIPAK